MSVFHSRFLILAMPLAICGGALIWGGKKSLSFAATRRDSGAEIALLKQIISERDAEIEQLKSAGREGYERPSAILAEGNADALRNIAGSDTPPVILGSYQVEKQGERFLFKDARGTPVFVFDVARRSIVAPNGLYIPQEGRLVMADTPPSGTKSESAESPLNLAFKNDSKSRLDIAWVNYDGKLKFYKTLQPGESYHQSTFETHPWVALNGAGKILYTLKPSKEDEGTEFVFDPQ